MKRRSHGKYLSIGAKELNYAGNVQKYRRGNVGIMGMLEWDDLDDLEMDQWQIAGFPSI